MFFFKILSFFSINKRNSLYHNIIVLNIILSPFFIFFFYFRIKKIMSEYNYIYNLIETKKNINNNYKINNNNNTILNYNYSYVLKELYDNSFQGFYITNINNKEIKGKINIIFRKEFFNSYFLDAILYNNQSDVCLISNTFAFNINHSFIIKKENNYLFNIKTKSDFIITSLNKKTFNLKKKYNIGNILLLYYNISNTNEKYLLGYFNINGTIFFFSTNNDKHSLISQMFFLGKIILILSIIQLIINFFIFDVTTLDKYEAIKYSSFSIIINFLSFSLILIQSLYLSSIDIVKLKLYNYIK